MYKSRSTLTFNEYSFVLRLLGIETGGCCLIIAPGLSKTLGSPKVGPTEQKFIYKSY